MIFGKDYDASLWYIVRADKKNGKELIEFIKELPNDLILEIRRIIERGRAMVEIEPGVEEELFDLYDCVSEIDPHISYSFQVESDDALTITKTYTGEEGMQDLFELRLYPVNPEYVKQMEYFQDEWFGQVVKSVRTMPMANGYSLPEENKREYNIYNTPFGRLVSYNSELGEKEITVFKTVKLNRMPKDIDVETLQGKGLK